MDDLSKGYRIIKTLKLLKDHIKQHIERHYQSMNLTGPQGMLVGILAHIGDMKISDLSEKMGLSNSTVSGIIDRLENQGYVERTRSKEDRRVVFVNLSADFRSKAEHHFKGVETMLSGLMENATPEELDKVLEGLETLEKLISRSSNHCELEPKNMNKE